MQSSEVNSPTCTLMLLVNLAYPKWITIDCNQRHFVDIACMEKLNTNVTNQFTYKLSKTFCSLNSVKNGVHCYEFFYYSGYDVDIWNNQLLYRKMFMSLRSIKELYFIVLAVNTFPTILSLDKYTTRQFNYIRYHNNIFVYHKRGQLNESSGYFIRITFSL